LLTHVDFVEVFDRVPIQMHQAACVVDFREELTRDFH
jgi:hypothetical protein